MRQFGAGNWCQVPAGIAARGPQQIYVCICENRISHEQMHGIANYNFIARSFRSLGKMATQVQVRSESFGYCVRHRTASHTKPFSRSYPLPIPTPRSDLSKSAARTNLSMRRPRRRQLDNLNMLWWWVLYEVQNTKKHTRKHQSEPPPDTSWPLMPNKNIRARAGARECVLCLVLAESVDNTHTYTYTRADTNNKSPYNTLMALMRISTLKSATSQRKAWTA